MIYVGAEGKMLGCELDWTGSSVTVAGYGNTSGEPSIFNARRLAGRLVILGILFNWLLIRSNGCFCGKWFGVPLWRGMEDCISPCSVMSLRGGRWFSRHWATLHFPIQLSFRSATRTKWVTLPQPRWVIDPGPYPPPHTHTLLSAETRRSLVCGGLTETKHRDTNQERCSRREEAKKTSSWETSRHKILWWKKREGERGTERERHYRGSEIQNDTHSWLLLTTSKTETEKPWHAQKEATEFRENVHPERRVTIGWANKGISER